MAPVPRPAFRRHLRTLSAEEFRRFVVALWEARGYTVTEAGSLLRVERADDRRTIAIAHDTYAFGRVRLSRGERSVAVDPSTSSDIDTIVTNTSGKRIRPPNETATSIIDVDDLYDVVLYAIPRPQARELLVDSLGLETPFGYPSPSMTAQSSWRTSALVWGIVLTILLGTVGGVVLNDGFGAPRVQSAGMATPTAFDPDVPSPTPDPSTPTPTATATPERNTLAPGVDMAGVFNAATLADAHRATITGRSYTLVVSYRERSPDRAPVVHVETIRVTAPALYVSSIERVGDPTLETPISDREIYANDRYRFERVVTDSGVRYFQRPIDSFSRLQGRNANRAARYVQQYLTGEESTLLGLNQRNETVYYVVRTTGDPRPGVRNATTTATIDSNGLVYRLHRTYQPANRSDVTVTITVEYTDIGNTSVEQPPWFQTARNRTD